MIVLEGIGVLEGPDGKVAERLSVIIRAYGHSVTETCAVTPWK
jgi:hypothetical protein